MPGLPNVFIGSSSEGLSVAEYLLAALDDHCDGTIWTQGVFQPSSITIEAIAREAQRVDFAVFVMTPDDILTKRGETKPVARDNVLFELGLFVGRLGLERTYIVMPRGSNLGLPTDLHGVTVVTYRPRPTDMRSAVHPAALATREAITQRGPLASHESSIQSTPAMRHDDSDQSARITRYVGDLVKSVSSGLVGIRVSIDDERGAGQWADNILEMLQDLFAERASDVYATWLRPAGDPPKLTVFRSSHLPGDYPHYEFAVDEGLAGKVWGSGTAAAQSVLRDHPWWVPRKGCENVTYICVPVGRPTGAGGVVAIGSNFGFDVNAEDVQIVTAFAELLTLTLVEEER